MVVHAFNPSTWEAEEEEETGGGEAEGLRHGEVQREADI